MVMCGSFFFFLGAPNVHADMWRIWLPPKSIVPASFDDAEPFVLDARPLRGNLVRYAGGIDELARLVLTTRNPLRD